MSGRWVVIGLGLLGALFMAAVLGLQAYIGEPSTRRGAETAADAPAAMPGDGQARASDAGPRPRSWAKLRWGAGEAQLGRRRLGNSPPEGPMSLAEAPNGEMVVLDQVNGRLVWLSGEGLFQRSTPVTLQAAEDVAVGAQSEVAVLDRRLDQAVVILSADGTVRGEVSLPGKNLPQVSESTGVLLRPDGGLYVGVPEGDWVRVGDAQARPDAERPVLRGKPTRSGQVLLAARFEQGEGGPLTVVGLEAQSGERRFARELRTGLRAPKLALLDSDERGVIYVGVSDLPTPAEPMPPVTLFCLSPRDGTPLGFLKLPPDETVDRGFREIAVLQKGGVLQARRTPEGVSFERYDCAQMP